MVSPAADAQIPPAQFADDAAAMRYAVALAVGGQGFVEPNPMVGAVVTTADRRFLGAGHHERFGGPHAEVAALANAGEAARGATLYVTLEPCCHFGKTPPCTRALLASGIARVVVGTSDPAPYVSGRGIEELRAAGLDVTVGVLEDECRNLIAPFRKRVCAGLPWVHAKWAMTLDGRIASRTKHSQWISNDASRRVVHELRGRMDAILVGAGTARADDPRLTARPAGPRQAVRVVVDARASLAVSSNLVRTARELPVLVACRDDAPAASIALLREHGVEVLPLAVDVGGDSPGDAGTEPNSGPPRVPLDRLLNELARRGMTNVLVEGGSQLLGGLFDRSLIDEAHVFVAPKLLGGAEAIGPIGGTGLAMVPEVASLENVEVLRLDGDLYIHGRVRR